jgi:hypothetical protein
MPGGRFRQPWLLCPRQMMQTPTPSSMVRMDHAKPERRRHAETTRAARAEVLVVPSAAGAAMAWILIGGDD